MSDHVEPDIVEEESVEVGACGHPTACQTSFGYCRWCDDLRKKDNTIVMLMDNLDKRALTVQSGTVILDEGGQYGYVCAYPGATLIGFKTGCRVHVVSDLDGEILCYEGD